MKLALVGNWDLAAILEDYQRDGVVRVPSVLDETELDDVRSRVEWYARQIVPNLPESDFVLESDGRTPRNFWRMEVHDPFFDELGHSPRITELVAPLVHGKPLLVGVETFNKPADVGSEVPWHQDNAYFCQHPPDVLTVWIAIDAVTPENGPVYYVKGSHMQGVLPHRASGVAGNSMGLVDRPTVPTEEQFCGTAQSGDALIHHCQTFHASAANRSNRPRLGLLLVYRGAHTQDEPALKAAYEKVRPQPA